MKRIKFLPVAHSTENKKMTKDTKILTPQEINIVRTLWGPNFPLITTIYCSQLSLIEHDQNTLISKILCHQRSYFQPRLKKSSQSYTKAKSKANKKG